jgi:phosphoribosylglycinamide formyltransferase 2
MLDGEALCRVVAEEKPDLIVPEMEAIATDTLAEMEAEGMATVIPTARATQLTMNREGIRRMAAEELGCKTSPYQFAGTRELVIDKSSTIFICLNGLRLLFLEEGQKISA